MLYRQASGKGLLEGRVWFHFVFCCHSQGNLDIFLDYLQFGRNIVALLSYKVGNSYLDHFEATGHLQDIDNAISHYQRAVELTLFGHANLPSYFNNLGKSYLGHFKQNSDLKDVDHAISHCQRAVESTPSTVDPRISIVNSSTYWFIVISLPIENHHATKCFTWWVDEITKLAAGENLVIFKGFMTNFNMQFLTSLISEFP